MEKEFRQASMLPAWTCVAQLVYAIRCLSRNEAKITQVMCGALHGSIEGTTNWYCVGVQLQRRPPAFLNICNQAGFWGTAVLVLVHERRDPVTLYVIGPRSSGEGGCEYCAFQTLALR